MTYHCDPGKFPYPVSSRTCGADGDWSPMRLPSGRRVSRPSCKGNIFLFSNSICFLLHLLNAFLSLPHTDMLCPGQLQLDNGDFWPTDQWFRVGTTQSFSCHEGFTLYGSEQRNCTVSGEWTGATPICDDNGYFLFILLTFYGSFQFIGHFHMLISYNNKLCV